MPQALTIAEVLQLAIESHRAGDLARAMEKYEQVLQAHPEHADALNLLGLAAYQKGSLGVAIEHLGRAAAIDNVNPVFAYNLGQALSAAGKLDLAVESYRRALALKPDYQDALGALGKSLLVQDRLDEANKCFRALLTHKPDAWEAFCSLGNVFKAQGNFDDAIECYERAIRLKPDCIEAHGNLGLALFNSGALDDAIFVFQSAIGLRPDAVDLHNNFGLVLRACDRQEEAAACFRRAIELKPDLHQAHCNLALSLQAFGRYEEAIAAFHQVIGLKPDFHEAYNSLGILLQNQYRLNEAVSCYEQALRIKPDYVEAHSNLVIVRDFLATAHSTAHLEERWRWDEQQVKRRGIVPRPPEVVADPERRLRIGYVSADLRRHSAASSFGLMLLHYDRSLHEIVCYSNSCREDDLTARFRDSVTRWRVIYGVPDENVADMIRADGIDILVDLSGHSTGNRLLVFARKPAPVQLSAWGCPNGTGLEAMDYLLTDAVSIPPEQQSYYREQLVYLPCTIAYMPPSETPLVKRLPASEAGHITFGFFNNYAKLSEEALALWAELLGALPAATIVFKGKAFTHDERRKRVLKIFSDAGVSAQRIRFLGVTSRKEHMAAHSDVDIALDPFPYVGGISTLEALWMGVPVITLKGVAMSHRTSAAILTTLGLTDWIAETPRQYLEIARRKACSIDELKILRQTLRERLRASPIMDPQVYVRAVETVYRQIWRKRCEQS